MIKLFGFGPAFGVPDPSSFVLKVDCYLRMANIEFERINGQQYLSKAPKGKLPYIEWEGRVIADSQHIINTLDENFDSPLESHLSCEQKAQSYLMTKSLDENLYWCLVYSRWIRDDGWVKTKDVLFSSLPGPVRLLVPPLVRRGIRKTLKQQGLGRHSDAEILSIAGKSIDALATLLAQTPYFFGERPSNFDATAFALLAQLVLATDESALSPLAKKHQNLVDYCQRIANEFYPNSFEQLL